MVILTLLKEVIINMDTCEVHVNVQPNPNPYPINNTTHSSSHEISNIPVVKPKRSRLKAVQVCVKIQVKQQHLLMHVNFEINISNKISSPCTQPCINNILSTFN